MEWGVWSVEWGLRMWRVESVERGVGSGVFGVWRGVGSREFGVERGVGSAEWNVETGVWSAEMWRLEFGAWSGNCGVWRWSMESVECRV